MNSEAEYLERLRRELEQEKADQENKRLKEMREAQEIIKENEIIRIKKEK